MKILFRAFAALLLICTSLELVQQPFNQKIVKTGVNIDIRPIAKAFNIDPQIAVWAVAIICAAFLVIVGNKIIKAVAESI